MAEYITIMVINNKTAGKLTFQLKREVTELDYPRTAQLTSELEDCKRLIMFIQEDICLYTIISDWI